MAWRRLCPIRCIRRERVGSTAVLAELCGVSKRTIDRWENGSRDPGRAPFFRLAEVLGVTAQSLHDAFELWRAERPGPRGPIDPARGT